MESLRMYEDVDGKCGQGGESVSEGNCSLDRNHNKYELGEHFISFWYHLQQ